MSWLNDLFGKAAPKVLQSVAPKITQTLPQQLQSMVKPEQLASMAKSVGSSFSLPSFGGSSSSGSATRVTPEDIRSKLQMSPEQYYNLTGEEKTRADKVLMPSSGSSWWNDLITDDPNSGWYDNIQNEAAEKARVQGIVNSGGMSPADLRRSEDTNLLSSATGGGFLDSAKDAFSGAYKKLASPVGLETLGGLAGGLGSMYLNKQGTNAALAGQDEAQNLIRQATAADLENFGKVGDSQEQLAYRQQAMKGLSDRASMGLTPEDQAALQGINRQAAQQFKANNATIGQDMARRGMANSGLGLAQSMGAADQALQNQALAGQNQAAQSFNAKQGALNNLASASNTALQGDYTRQLGKAQNLSAVNQFNAQQQGMNAAKKGSIQQVAKTAQAGGVQNIAKGVIGQGFFDKDKEKV